MARRLVSEFSTSVMKNDIFSRSMMCGILPSRVHAHANSLVRPQGDGRFRPDVLPGQQLEAPALDERRQREQRLQPGETLAQAMAVARAEREIGAARQLGGEGLVPALGPE